MLLFLFSHPTELWIGSLSFYAICLLSVVAIFLPSFYMFFGGINPLLWVVRFVSLNPTRVSNSLLWEYWKCCKKLMIKLVMLWVCILTWVERKVNNQMRSKCTFKKPKWRVVTFSWRLYSLFKPVWNTYLFGTFLFQMRLVIYWVFIVLLSFAVVLWKTSYHDKSKSTLRIPKIIIRKIFHVLVVAIFAPGILYDPALLHLCSGVAVSIFLFVEVR